MDEIRIGIIDDHSIVRQGLRAMIDRELDLRVVGEAPSARQATAMLDRAQPGVVLLDLKLTAGSECDGLSLCSAITQRFPDSRVLVLTSSAEEWLILASIKQGAKGFVLKDVDLTELIRAVRAVHRGECLRPPQRRSRRPLDAREPSRWRPSTRCSCSTRPAQPPSPKGSCTPPADTSPG